MLVLYGIANAVLYPISSNNKTKQTSATIVQVTSHYGLKPDTQYPLKLGQRFAGTFGSMTVNGNFFFVHGNGSWAPATAISVGFASQGKSYILEIPTSKITLFNQTKQSLLLASISTQLLMRATITSSERTMARAMRVLASAGGTATGRSRSLLSALQIM